MTKRRYRNMKNSNVPPYIRLAAEIVLSGRRCNDQCFLKSKWCAELKDAVELYLNETGHKMEKTLL